MCLKQSIDKYFQHVIQKVFGLNASSTVISSEEFQLKMSWDVIEYSFNPPFNFQISGVELSGGWNLHIQIKSDQSFIRVSGWNSQLIHLYLGIHVCIYCKVCSKEDMNRNSFLILETAKYNVSHAIHWEVFFHVIQNVFGLIASSTFIFTQAFHLKMSWDVIKYSINPPFNFQISGVKLSGGWNLHNVIQIKSDKCFI